MNWQPIEEYKREPGEVVVFRFKPVIRSNHGLPEMFDVEKVRGSRECTSQANAFQNPTHPTKGEDTMSPEQAFLLGIAWMVCGVAGAARGFYRLGQVYKLVAEMSAGDWITLVVLSAMGPASFIAWVVQSLMMGRKP